MCMAPLNDDDDDDDVSKTCWHGNRLGKPFETQIKASSNNVNFMVIFFFLGTNDIQAI